MILVLTSSGDLTSDYVIDALNNLNAAVVRLNTNDLLNEWRFEITPSTMWFESNGRSVQPADVSAVYFRRAYEPEPPSGMRADARHFVAREARVVIRALYSALDCCWVSNPTAIELAENKPRQLNIARTLGFNVPATVVTNQSNVAEQFVAQHSPVVIKAVSYGDLGDGKVLHTTLVDNWSDEFRHEIELGPVLLQEYITKRCEYRVTVVGSTLFCCRIDSQGDVRYSVDMRRGLADESMVHELVDLEPTTQAKCVELVARLGLKFGAIDLVEDTGGLLWFLEINPNGQWAWIEDRTGAPIARTLAEMLKRG